MTKKKEKHNKHYWEEGRNGYYHNTTLDTFGCPSKEEQSVEVDEEEDLRVYTKTLESYVKDMEGYLLKGDQTYVDERVPEYYKGKNGYEARKVCDNFDLPYHLATATTYIIRAYHKHNTPIDCLTKAIAHLEFELEKWNELQV
tara:strand:- start:1305 stop:1733 length:429 start_codon:yes stop_codon:yes gene_type:complete